MGGVLGVVAADVEEEADIMGLQHRDDALEVLVLAGLELVAAGADGAGGGGGAEQGDLVVGGGGEVDQLLLEHALDAEIAGVEGAEGGRVAAAAVDDSAQGVVDDAGGSARLGDDDVAGWHIGIP